MARSTGLFSGLATALVLSAALCGAGCSTGKPWESDTGSSSSEEDSRADGNGAPFGPLLPYPLGSIRYDDDPFLNIVGWLGIAAGAVGGPAAVLNMLPSSSLGTGVFLFLVALPVSPFVGAIGGGCILTLLVRGLRALFGIFSGDDGPG